MNIESFQMERTDVRKLLSAGSADASLLYIYLQAGNDLAGAESDLNMTPSRISCAAATLRQLGLV